MVKKKKMLGGTYTVALALFILCASSVLAIDRSPYYDYSGNGNNVSALNNGAFFNNTEVVRNGITPVTGDGSNDYITITPAAGVNGLCEFSPNTNWTVAVRLYYPLATAGNDMFFRMCQDKTGNGSGYGFITISNVNRIGLENGSTTLQSSNTTMNLTYDQWFWVVYQYYGNNTSAWWNNGSVVFNGSTQGQFANKSVTDNTTLLAFNGGAQVMPGSVGEVLVYRRSLTHNEVINITNGSASGLGIVDTRNLTMWLPFRNTTTVNLSINTANFTSNKPDRGQGYHALPTIVSSFGWIKTPSDAGYYTRLDFLQNQLLLQLSRAREIRSSTDVSNTVNLVTIVSATNLTLGYRTDTANGTLNRNINHLRQLLNYSNATGGRVVMLFDDTFIQLANNSSPMCEYGITDSLAASCMYSNTTQGAQAKARFLIDVGCFNYTYDICIVEDENEPYNPVGTTFWLTNATVAQRTAELIVLYNGTGRFPMRFWLTQWGYNADLIHDWRSPSFSDLSSSGTVDAQNMAVSFMTAFPVNGTYSPNTIATHLYCYDAGACTLPTQMIQWQNLMDNYSYGSNWGISEGGLLDLNDNYNESLFDQAVTAQAQIVLQTQTRASFFDIFQASHNEWDPSTEENPSFLNSQFVNNTVGSGRYGNFTHGSYIAQKTYGQVPDNVSVYECSTNNTAVTCLYGKYNATNAWIYLVNKQSLQIDVDNITVSGLTVNSATRTTQGLGQLVNTTTSASGSTVDVGFLYPYGITTYYLTLNATNVSVTGQPSTYIVNITEPNYVVFNISITNPSNVTYNITWYNQTGGAPLTACQNLTTCTPISASYSSAGNYNVSAVVTAETNTVTTNWLYQINNTVTNISFTSVTPNNSTVYIDEGDSQTFSYVLNNTGNVTTFTNWYRDGNNVTACYGATSCQFTSLTAGTFTINVTVSAGNTVSNAWNLVVIDGGSAVSASICRDSSDAVGELGGWLVTISLVLGAAIVIGVIMAYNGSLGAGLSIDGLGSAALILVGAAITISIAAMIVVSAIC